MIEEIAFGIVKVRVAKLMAERVNIEGENRKPRGCCLRILAKMNVWFRNSQRRTPYYGEFQGRTKK